MVGRRKVDVLTVEIESGLDDRYVLVRVSGAVDISTAGQLAAGLDRAAIAAPAIILDLRAVDFFAAVGVSCVAARMSPTVPQLRLVYHDPGPVALVLRVLDLYRLWPAHGDVCKAVAQLADGDSI